MALVLNALNDARSAPVDVVCGSAFYFVKSSVNVHLGSIGQTKHSLVFIMGVIGELVVSGNVSVLFRIDFGNLSVGLSEDLSAEVEFLHSAVGLAVFSDKVHEIIVVLSKWHS